MDGRLLSQTPIGPRIRTLIRAGIRIRVRVRKNEGVKNWNPKFSANCNLDNNTKAHGRPKNGRSRSVHSARSFAFVHSFGGAVVVRRMRANKIIIISLRKRLLVVSCFAAARKSRALRHLHSPDVGRPIRGSRAGERASGRAMRQANERARSSGRSAG